MKAPPCFDDPETRKIIRQICEQHGIDTELLKDLCELMNEYSGAGRRFGLPDEIDGIINRFFTRTDEA
jgi:hypothetical protein